MPELPEVEVLVRHLRPLLERKEIRRVQVFRKRVIRPTSVQKLARSLSGARIRTLERRGKYLLFHIEPAKAKAPFTLLGHLGMTGRMYLQPRDAPLPKHTSVAMDLGRQVFVFEDTRYFGRFTLETDCLENLGPEPLSVDFRVDAMHQQLRRSRQAIKIKLLDQRLVAGIGNIYASEALFRAGIAPQMSSRRLDREQVQRLWKAIREVLTEAIRFGSTVPLNYPGKGNRDGLFYFGSAPGTPDFYTERLLVYDREHQPCCRCRTSIRRLVQAGRSSFFCPRCQKRTRTGSAAAAH